MKKILFILFIATIISLSAQDTDVLIGRGEDTSFEVADQKAIRDLCSQISVQVNVEFKDTVKETNSDTSQMSEQIIQTYSSVMLDNVERKVTQGKDGKYIVTRILAKADRRKLFEHRQNKIFQYITTAGDCEDKGEIGLALKNYYWALLLLKSHPDIGSIFVENNPNKGQLLPYLMTKIQKLLNTINIKVTQRKDERETTILYVEGIYNDLEIASLNMNYFDGVQPTETQLKDGKGIIYLPASITKGADQLFASVDYEYAGFLRESPQDDEVKAVFQTVPRVSFDNRKTISLMISNGKNGKKAKKNEVVEETRKVEVAETNTTMLQAVLDHIKSGGKTDIRQYFSDSGYEQFRKIMNYGTIRLYEGASEIKSYQVGKQLMIRSIPLEISLKDKNRKIIKDDISLIVENDKIVWVNFTINDHYMKNNLTKGNNLGDLTERLKSIQFIEYYKTCYALKELDKISDIFADSALIFIGYVKAKAPVNKDLQNIINQEMKPKELEIQKLTKTQFIDRTRKIFNANPVINLQFDDIQIVKRSRDKAIYAVQMKQDYYSTNYSDKGYLLLFYDMSDEENPKIFFRYWQPSKMMPEEVDAFERMTGRFRF